MIKVIVGVQVETPQGLFVINGKPFYETGDAVTNASDGYVSYPDKRVKNFRIFVAYRAVEGAPWGPWHMREWAAHESAKANMSWAYVGSLTYSDFAGEPELSDADLQAMQTLLVEEDANRMLVSTVHRPRDLRGQNALFVGDDSADGILSFESAAEEVSQGQFGQFPLYVVCRKSIWVAEVGKGEILFSGVLPVTVKRGAIGHRAATVVGKTLYYVSDDGVYALGKDEPISFWLGGTHGDSDFIVGEGAEIYHFVDSDAGRNELHVRSEGDLYCYSLVYNAWFTLTGDYSHLVRIARKNLFLSDGVVYEDVGPASRVGHVRFAPLDMGLPDQVKRFRRIIAVLGSNAQYVGMGDTAYAARIDLERVMAEFHGLDIEYEPRYGHRASFQIFGP